MRRQTPLSLLPLLLLPLLHAQHVHAAAILDVLLKPPPGSQNASDSHVYHAGLSVVGARPAALSAALHTPPLGERDPDGLTVYDSLEEVPTAQLLRAADAHSKCYAGTGGRQNAVCWRPYVCGHRCEQILLAVDAFCRKAKADGAVCKDGDCDWVSCKKARKYNRCFARICFRRKGGEGPGLLLPPQEYEDTQNVAIVRYRKPPPRYEVLARRNRQSSTQSAIFK